MRPEPERQEANEDDLVRQRGRRKEEYCRYNPFPLRVRGNQIPAVPWRYGGQADAPSVAKEADEGDGKNISMRN